MQKVLAIIIILIVSALASLPLAQSGFFVIHDDQQIARLYLFDEAIKFGQFPVRWVSELGFGFGYPLFVFYPPLVYIVGEAFHLIGFNFIDSVKLVFFTSIFVSAITMYIFSKELFGRLPGLISAAFYVFVPYRALDIYVRGALAESFSFVWPPIILWSFFMLYKTQKTVFTFYSAVFLTLLMITHNLIFLPFMMLLPIFLLFLLYKSENRGQLTKNLIYSAIISAGLSAFFWMPALLEKKHTIVDSLLVVNLASYNIHFVYPQQLWNWQWGFGGSAEGLADGISFKIGKLHVVATILAALLATVGLIRNKSKTSPFFQFSILFFALFIVSAFLTTYFSKPVWDIIKPLSYLQFPWRFLTFTALFSSLLAGALIFLLKLPILKITASVILITLLIMPNLKLFKPQSYRAGLTDEIATSKETINWDISLSSFEYAPAGVELYTGELGTNLINIDKSEIPTQKVEVLTGDISISNLSYSPTSVKFDASAQTPSTLKANIFNFPGWNVSSNGENIEIFDDNNLKLITFNVPEGEHKASIDFKNTKTRLIANMISLFTLILLLSIFTRKWLRHNTSLI